MTRNLKLKFSTSLSRLLLLVLVLPVGTHFAVQGSTGQHGTRRGSAPKSAAKPTTSPTPTPNATGVKRSKKSYLGSTSVKKRMDRSPGVKKGTTQAAGAESPKTTTSSASSETATTTHKGIRERRVTGASYSGKSAASKTTPVKSGRCNPDKDEHVDLSGSYTGVINYPAAGMSGPATLTVTGNKFTLNSGSKTETGNITAIVTCNYTAVAMMFGQWKTPTPGEPVLPPLPMLSLTATRKGDRLTLKPASSERREFLFEPGDKK